MPDYWYVIKQDNWQNDVVEYAASKSDLINKLVTDTAAGKYPETPTKYVLCKIMANVEVDTARSVTTKETMP